MLARKLSEGAWQSFFTDNPFVLRLAFGHPIMMIGGQISVGGRKFSGAGDKISDFVIKAAASGNLGLIEIKTPDTLLIEKTPYRGDLHAPSRELTGAVNQILDQRHHLQKSIPALKDNSGAWDVQSYAIQGLVIAGRIPEGAALLKSFELFRNALKSVTIITFDELGHKLEHLLEVLGTSNAMPDEKLDGIDAK
nr:Shedu immune nuclease family protein [Bradyrhizobium sp. G127]